MVKNFCNTGKHWDAFLLDSLIGSKTRRPGKGRCGGRRPGAFQQRRNRGCYTPAFCKTDGGKGNCYYGGIVSLLWRSTVTLCLISERLKNRVRWVLLHQQVQRPCSPWVMLLALTIFKKRNLSKEDYAFYHPGGELGGNYSRWKWLCARMKRTP